MIKKLFFLTTFSLLFTMTYSQDAEDIKGYWLTEDGESQIYIYKAKNGSFYGKIAWLEEPTENGVPRTDEENPDADLRDRPLQDLLILKSFEYDPSEKNWSGGTIYDPESGKTYDAYMWFENGDTDELMLKGYVLGMKWLGRETTWKREGKR